eukprot:UN30214
MATHNLTLIAGLPGGKQELLTTTLKIYYSPTCARIIDHMTLIADLNLYNSDDFTNTKIFISYWYDSVWEAGYRWRFSARSWSQRIFYY